MATALHGRGGSTPSQSSQRNVYGTLFHGAISSQPLHPLAPNHGRRRLLRRSRQQDGLQIWHFAPERNYLPFGDLEESVMRLQRTVTKFIMM